ncbi:MAG TPA: isopentenyl-diphosphate delta-isomerase [Cryomorphaceae bacterium]|jgi:isopentenyl-diphosphate Delta-isomerase|nr:MAG: isopentenyl-diphosphate delta-isomerase [Cryomorphaceae bacterium BACL7 MAG-120910-bin2]KRO69281.1 MAG: isopentenyl-diphosphate delta-isomerase [Cryomorphaceae bacterium BACL7 MAG-120322-bin74]KRO82366.1 MAG: isopentenyl-diphosphate delta-isomerase [Cryomorphaceae bacterium BACL7 MAG-121220-bin83]NQW25160.1 isopentenyl-diphosphate Delta-isomerase [Cryomorphaceae bacterium]HAB31050.1 isopentenyl-diphosphate delta-isomerase [Cryomorphaceae bacterium]|tara:strand:+ start:56 stop:586 length:531 start_codon:yes stop_codon:yes gene_type:complete
MKEYVILVDPEDQPVGRMEKMEAHEKGELHRAFSVFLFNEQGETLLQQRASGKYHSPLLWTNTCCSHPRVGETILEAAKRRVQEELGIHPAHIEDLRPAFHFIYRAAFENGLIEHELDHVLMGTFQGTCALNRDEVADVAWITLPNLFKDIALNPARYTAWFKIILVEYAKHLPTR